MINLNSYNLIEGFDLVNRIKPDYIYLKSVDSKLKLMMVKSWDLILYDLEYNIKDDVNIQLDIDNTVTFNRMIKYFKSDDHMVNLKIDYKDSQLIIYNDKRDLKVGFDPSNIDASPELIELKSTLNIEGTRLKSIVDGLDTIRGKNSARPNIDGLSVTPDGFIALDGYMLALYNDKLDIKDSYIIPDNTVTYLKRVLVKHQEDYKIEDYKNKLVITTKNIKIITNEVLRGVFDYKSIIDPTPDISLDIKVNDFIDAIGYLKNIADQVDLTIKDKINLKSVIKDQEASTNFKYTNISGSDVGDFKIIFNPDLMDKVLKLYDKDLKLQVNFKGSLNPIIFKDEKITSLILPMRTSRS